MSKATLKPGVKLKKGVTIKKQPVPVTPPKKTKGSRYA